MKRTPLRPVSARRRRENAIRAERRKALIGQPCEAQLSGCAYTGTDWHELLSRARGGSITDESNRAWLCRPVSRVHHDASPVGRESAGWSLSRWEK